MKQIKVNNVRTKALHWWRSLSPEMKKTMVHNPHVNQTDVRPNIHFIDRSSIRIHRMFENWLKWEIEGGSENE